MNHFLIKVNLRCRGSFHSGGGHQGGDRARHQPDDVSVHGITSLHYCQDDTNSVTPVKLALYFIYEIIITDILAFCSVYKANTNSCCCFLYICPNVEWVQLRGIFQIKEPSEKRQEIGLPDVVVVFQGVLGFGPLSLFNFQNC